MAGFTFRLELEDGTPADPPVLHTAVPNWSAGRHDPAGPRQDPPRGRDSRRRPLNGLRSGCPDHGRVTFDGRGADTPATPSSANRSLAR
jgi:hypothetical protein